MATALGVPLSHWAPFTSDGHLLAPKLVPIELKPVKVKREETEEAPFLGTVAAGPFDRAREAGRGETKSVRPGLPADCFVLQVTGDSVAGFGISDGDYIIVQPADTPVPGRLMVARGPDGFTLKGCSDERLWSYWLKDGKAVEIPVPYGEEVAVVGLVIEKFGAVGCRASTTKPKPKAKPKAKPTQKPKPKKK